MVNNVVLLIAPTGYGKTFLVWHNLPNLSKNKCLWLDCRTLVDGTEGDYTKAFIKEVRSFFPSAVTPLDSIKVLTTFDGIIVIDNLEFCCADGSGSPLGTQKSWISASAPDLSSPTISEDFKWLKDLVSSISQVKTNSKSPRLIITSQCDYTIGDYTIAKNIKRIRLANRRYFFNVQECEKILSEYSVSR